MPFEARYRGLPDFEMRLKTSPAYIAYAQDVLNREEELPDTFWLPQSLPFSDITDEWLHDDGLIYKTREAFNLERLAGVRALSLLATRSSLSENTRFTDNDATHNRDDHSQAVALVMDKVLTRNQRSPHEITAGIIAGMTHDGLTTAWGDSVKGIDRANLHEEEHLDDLFTPQSLAFLDEHGMTTEELQQIICNQGLLGVVLDHVDRIVYTMKDVNSLIQQHVPALTHPRYDDIRLMVQEDPHVGNIYRDLMIEPQTETVYFNDPRRLFHFLALRAQMHTTFYYNPETAGRDRLFSHFVKPFYSPDKDDLSKPLTPQVLRTWTDRDLLSFLMEKYNVSHDVNLYEEFANWYPDFDRFDSEEDAEQARQDYQQDPNKVVMDIIKITGFNPATSYLTKNDEGDIVPFSTADPEGTMLIDYVVDQAKGVFLFYTDITTDTPMNRLIKQVWKDTADDDVVTRGG